jgi:hypothetical protein
MPLVTVKNHSLKNLLLNFGCFQQTSDQPNGIFSTQPVSNNEPIIQVFNHSQVSPPLFGGNISHIGNPFLVWSVGRKIPPKHISVSMAHGQAIGWLQSFPASADGSEADFLHDS